MERTLKKMILTPPSMTALTTGWSCNAYAAAFENTDMKPNLIPYFFTKASKLALRNSMMELQMIQKYRLRLERPGHVIEELLYRPHVDFVECGQHCGRILCILQT